MLCSTEGGGPRCMAAIASHPFAAFLVIFRQFPRSEDMRCCMSFRAGAKLAALFVFTLVALPRTRAQQPPPSQPYDLSSLSEHASAGDAQAQFDLANDYFRTRHVTLEYGQALAWYRKSADQGYAPAQNQLGTMYQHGFGVLRNFKLALAYYRKAADQGYAPAQFNLGVLYESGKYGVKRDYKQALAWYRKAADQNLADGEREVAYFYQCGFGVKRDFTQALAWYRRSADHGSAMAENQLGYFAEEGWGERQDYTQALSWYSKAAERGNDSAQENLGYMFQHGTGVAVDYAKARYWYYKAAAQGNSDAENQLGWMYQYGQGVKQSNANALAWYQLAADQGNVKGQNNLQAFSDELEDEGNNSADAPVNDAAIDQARRWARDQYLRARIDGLEADALSQDSETNDLEHMGKGNKDAISKVMDAVGNAVSVSPRLKAQRDREEASRLRDELTEIGNENRATA